MLVQFRVENFKSIKEPCELSMVASKYFKENEQTNTFDTGLEDFPRLLKSIVIYGPNAAGKSTIIDAIKFLSRFVGESATKSNPGEPIKVAPFKLSDISRNSDTSFEIVFIQDNIRYEYGLCVNSRIVTEEWLFAYPAGKAQKWFHRIWDKHSEEYQYKFSNKFEGGRIRQDWQKQTRNNASYLSVAAQYNSEQLLPVYEWFEQRLFSLKPNALTHEYTARDCKDAEIKKRVMDFIQSADISLSDIKVTSRKVSDVKFPDDMPESIRAEITKNFQDQEFFDVNFIREDDKNQPISFEFHEESQGTQGLFKFAGPWLDVISNDLILFVDELDSSLHPLIVHHLVDILHKSDTKAQIIFTTHDTTILSQRALLRRDQVWFVNKDRSQASQLYPLSDYNVRDGEAVEKGYLSGRYGAVPFIKDMSFDGVRWSVSPT